jgi:TonB-dependent receptor-like protein
VISGNQVRALPLEARSVVGLLSLQAGAVFVPTNTLGDQDNRSGAVSGARADQANVTLDGVDNNDPLYNTAYTGALRSTLDSLQEFRVTTSNYGAESGRSSAAQVSLVTKSGTNVFHGSAYDVIRRTSTSANEYFNKLAGNEVPKLDKNIYGGAFGGAIIKDKLFFFGNYERLHEDSEALTERQVPSLSMRDGVMVYQCADPSLCPGGTVQGFSDSHVVAPGYYGATPSQLAGLDPLGIGPSVAASEYFKGLPGPNDPGLDGYNIMSYKFTAPFQNTFNTTIGRVDYRPGGNQTFFGRFNMQRDTLVDVPQFPDRNLPPNTSQDVKNWGTAIGWDSVLSSTMVNTFRYGYTKMVIDRTGTLTGPAVYFRFADDLNEGFTTNGRRTPTHNIVNDTTWLKGAHTLKFGTNLRFTRIPSYTNGNSFSYATVNPSWVNGVGRTYTPGRDSCDLSGCSAIPAVADGWNWADAWITMLGVVSQGTGQFLYDRDRNVLPAGTIKNRNYGIDEYEFYAQDSWRLGDKLTVNGGLRYSLASPPWETNGLQEAPNVSLGDRFNQRREMMAKGIPENTLPDISFVLAGPENGRKGFYDWDKNNFAPRVSAAWTPTSKLVLRGGYSLVYDRLGPALVRNFDANGSFGLAPVITSPYAGTNEDDPSVRFQGINVLPPSVPAPPQGGFPVTPPDSSDIFPTIDDTLVTPYAHTFNAVATFELTKNFTIEGAYVGRQGRNLLVQRDLFMSLNLKDPQSGTDYYTAATELVKQLEANDMDYTKVTPIAYFENLFPDAVNASQVWGDPTFAGLTATQVMASEFAFDYPDHQTAMFDFDLLCYPACTKFGPYSYLNRQYAALSAQSTIGRSAYNALQLTLRRRYSNGYQFDLNYTYGVAKDHGSLIERNDVFSEPTLDFGLGGYTGFMINSWEPDQQYSYSDFDIRHQMNFNWVAEFPWGRGRKWGSDMSPWLDAVVGGWSMAGLTRLTSGLPFNVINARSAWATNWNLQGNASLKDPGRLPPTGTTKNVLNGKPSPFSVSPEKALEFFRYDYPGESGIRNLLRGDGYFSLDFSLAKSWPMPYSGNHKLWFRWDTFNVTNTPRFDVANVTMYPDRTSTFGTYNGTYASCDGNAGRCMQFSVRYEF